LRGVRVRIALRIERDDLAVEDERLLPFRGPLRQGGGNFRELLRLLVAEPRPESDGAAPGRDLGDRADAVVLGFVNELGIDKRRVGQRREHRLQEVVHAGCW
jgi:hypothetical protein